MDSNLELFSSNLKSLISIYNDSNEIREKKASELAVKMNDWSADDFDDFFHYSIHFEWLLLQSLFISGFAYLESFMRLAALQIESTSNSKIKLQDINGKGLLDTYRKYIYLIGKIDAANSDLKEWKEINEFKLIRNSLTHNNGIITAKLDKITQHNIYYGQSEKLIRIKNIKFLEDFCEISIKYMESIVQGFNKNYAS